MPQHDASSGPGDAGQSGEMPARGHLDQLLTDERPDLVRFVGRRLNHRLRTRVDASDIVQETLREAHRRYEDFVRQNPMPFAQWLRKLAYDRVVMEYRRHIGAAQRSIHREAMLCDDSSVACAERLLADESTPSRVLCREERIAAVRQALERLEPGDREILCMRTVDELPYDEIASLLDIQPTAARQRYGRALVKLSACLKAE